MRKDQEGVRMAAATKVQNCQISNYPISKVLLDGLYDPDCLLSQLRGCQHVMRRIWEELLIYWVRAIRLPQKDLEKGEYMGRISKANENRPQPFYLTPIDMDPDVGGYGFPVRENTKDPININMMPFIAAAEFEECKLPECVRPYWSLIKACLAPEMDRSWHHLWPARRIPSEKGKVNYLTIQVVAFYIDVHCHVTLILVIILNILCPGELGGRGELTTSRWSPCGQSRCEC